MSTAVRNVTADELIKLPRGRARYELVRGELRTMSPSGSEHAMVSVRLSTLIDQFASTHRLGLVFGAEAGYRLDRDPDTVLAPDVSFIRQERIPPSGPPQGFWPGAPDLAVEVASPGDSAREINEKAEQWLRAGCRAVWVVNPRSRTATVFNSDGARQTLAATDSIDGGDVLPGFSCRVAELFWHA